MRKFVFYGLLAISWLVAAKATHSQNFSLSLPEQIAGREVGVRRPVSTVPDGVRAQLLLPDGQPSSSRRYPTFNSPVLDRQLERYLKYVEAFGTPDILIVGSSRSLQGIDPVALERALVARGYPRMRVFNFGINGATAQVVNFLLQRILIPEQLPKVLVWGDGLRAFNSGRKDATYQAILASGGYRQLFAGARPAIARSRPERMQKTPSIFCLDIPGNPLAELLPWSSSTHRESGKVDVALTTGYPSVNQTLSAAAIAASLRQHPIRKFPCYTPRTHSAERFPNYFGQSIQAQPQILLSNGFSSVPTQFEPKTYYQSYPRVSGRYDGDYVPFIVEGGPQFAALRSVAIFARTQRIPLVVVNMPLSQPHLDRVRLAYERQFDQKMQRLAMEEGFRFRNFLQRWPTRHDYFADPSHLNRHGARALATHIAQDPTIPWPKR